MTGTGEYTLSLAGEPSDADARSHAHVATDTGLAALVETYGTLLFRVAFSLLRNRAEAEDAVQDTFVRVLRRRGPLSEIRDPRVWLVRITWNLALDRRRRIRPDQIDAAFAASLATNSAPADHALGQAQQLTQLLAAIEKLPRLERQVLLLSAFEELDTPAIAAIIGKSESAARALLFRARARLKQRTEGGRK